VSEILTCAAVLSVEPIFLAPSSSSSPTSTSRDDDDDDDDDEDVEGGGGASATDKRKDRDPLDEARAEAAIAHRGLSVRDGDLPTLVRVFHSYFNQSKASTLPKSQSQGSDSNLVGAGKRHATGGTGTGKVVVMLADENGDDASTVSAGAAPAGIAGGAAAAGVASRGGSGGGGTDSASAALSERRRWGIAHHVSWRALERAGKVRQQLSDIVRRAPLHMDPNQTAATTASAAAKTAQAGVTGAKVSATAAAAHHSMAAPDTAEEAFSLVAGEQSQRAAEPFLKCLAQGLFMNVAMLVEDDDDDESENGSGGSSGRKNRQRASGGSGASGGSLASVEAALFSDKKSLLESNGATPRKLLVARVIVKPPPPQQRHLFSNALHTGASTGDSKDQDLVAVSRLESSLMGYVTRAQEEEQRRRRLELSSGGAGGGVGGSAGGVGMSSNTRSQYVLASPSAAASALGTAAAAAARASSGKGGQGGVDIHPSSVLFGRRKPPKCVVFAEVVVTTKPYMRGVTAVDARWLVELCPHAFAFQQRATEQQQQQQQAGNVPGTPSQREQDANRGDKGGAVGGGGWRNATHLKRPIAKRNSMVDG